MPVFCHICYDYLTINVQSLKLVLFLQVSYQKFVCNFLQHHVTSLTVILIIFNEEYRFNFIIFRLVKQFFPALCFFLPLDSNILLGTLFSNVFVLLQTYKLLYIYIFFEVIYFKAFVHCLVLKVTTKVKTMHFVDRIIWGDYCFIPYCYFQHETGSQYIKQMIQNRNFMFFI